MTLQAIPEMPKYEQALIGIIHTLPAERIQQILDYARYIQTQTLEDFALLEDENPEDIAADEARWDAQFAASQSELTTMAARVRAEIAAGKARPMGFTKDGKIVPA
ncbi:MAG: hypothetical protein R2911_18290 [Caldilineaceae bacterium]